MDTKVHIMCFCSVLSVIEEDILKNNLQMIAIRFYCIYNDFFMNILFYGIKEQFIKHFQIFH